MINPHKRFEENSYRKSFGNSYRRSLERHEPGEKIRYQVHSSSLSGLEILQRSETNNAKQVIELFKVDASSENPLYRLENMKSSDTQKKNTENKELCRE